MKDVTIAKRWDYRPDVSRTVQYQPGTYSVADDVEEAARAAGVLAPEAKKGADRGKP